MHELPPIQSLFPPNEGGAIRRFWAVYWGWFLLFLPWMFLRQVGISLHQTLGVLWTWCREMELIPGELRLLFVASPRSLLVTALFGERFTAIHYRDVLIDPGPPFGRRRMERWFAGAGAVRAIVATHAHEEHVGNAALAAARTGAAVHGTHVTLEAMRSPPRLSRARRVFIGQPAPVPAVATRVLGDALETAEALLDVLRSPGHCDGHASLFEREHGLLFAGDSFLHTVFTSPNRDASGEDWIRTLRAYLDLDVRTMIGTHGYVVSRDERLRPRAFVVRRGDPRALIRDKLAFLEWAREVVREGERRGLPYSVVEACLFPWQRWWSWGTWFTDESGRLFSAGEFSRTHFVRTLAAHPDKVPPRFPPFARLARLVSGKESA